MKKYSVIALFGMAAMLLNATATAHSATFVLESGARVAVEPFNNSGIAPVDGVNPGETAALEASFALQQTGVTAFYQGPSTLAPAADSATQPQPWSSQTSEQTDALSPGTPEESPEFVPIPQSEDKPALPQTPPATQAPAQNSTPEQAGSTLHVFTKNTETSQNNVADIADYVLTGTIVSARAESGSPYSFGNGLRVKLMGEVRYTFLLKEAASGRVVASGSSAGMATRMQSHSYDNEQERLAYHRRNIFQLAAENAAQKMAAQLKGEEAPAASQGNGDDRSIYQDSPGKRLKAQ